MAGWDRQALQELRSAVAQRDDAAIVELCAGRELDAVLQLIGEALRPECADRLRQRGYDGDAELADVLDGRADDLRPIAVDLEELASILDGDPVHGGGRIDLETGEIWHRSPYDDHDEEDSERWHWVGADSRAGWRDMEKFIATVADASLAERLERAIHRPSAFRRFRDALAEQPDELTRFHQFADEHGRGRARRWLAEWGLRPAHRAPVTAADLAARFADLGDPDVMRRAWS